MGQAWASREGRRHLLVEPVCSVDSLRSAIIGADIDVVQLQRGRMKGHLVHAVIEDLGFSHGSFSLSLRSAGVLNEHKVVIGTLLAASGHATHLSDTVLPGDILIHPPGAEHHAVYNGPATFAGLVLAPDELAGFFAGEACASEHGWWMKRHHCRPPVRPCPEERLEMFLLRLEAQLKQSCSLSAEAEGYWKRAVIEAFVAPLVDAIPVSRSAIVPSAIRIVREVERYIEARKHRAVHISEICAAMNVSRRTLYRAFEEALGRGAISFLRMKRLSMAHSRLRNADPRADSVTHIATELGFLELGRFSHQYYALFGEYPRETLSKRTGGRSNNRSEQMRRCGSKQSGAGTPLE
jgi:AraC-like DNA-binding protein